MHPTRNGVEYRHPATLFRLGALGSARPIAAIDTKSWQQRDWMVGVSARMGVEVQSTGAAGLGNRRMSLLLEYYNGPTPYGQFYADDTSYLGFGFHVHF